MKSTQHNLPKAVSNKQVQFFQVQLSFLQYLKKVMIPHSKLFNILDFFQLILNYCMKLPNQTFEDSIKSSLNESKMNLELLNLTEKSQTILTDVIPRRNYNKKKIEEQKLTVEVKQRKIKSAQQILDKFKDIFLWYKKGTISYQMINNYILSCQNYILKQNNSLQNISQYLNLPQRRIRLDENVKLCIMPQGDSSRIKFLSINPAQQNNQDIYRKQIYVVTSQHIRSIKVDAQKLAKQGNKTTKIHDTQNQQLNKINIVKNWYTYSQQKIFPQNANNNSQNMKIKAKKQLYIQKISMSQNLVGMITHQRDILIKPLLKECDNNTKARINIPYQIKMGNLIYDIPDQNLQIPLSRNKAKLQQMQRSKILLFQSYNDEIWIVVNEQFVYVYILPPPDYNQMFNDEQQRSSLLSLCESLPVRGLQAKLLTKQYLAIMIQSPCVLILKLQLSSKKQHRSKNRIYPTNKIYNDIKFICMDYHPVDKKLLFTDFGGYLIRLKFNISNGDIQREGAVYDGQTAKYLTQNTTNTRRDKEFSALKKQSQINLHNSLLSHFDKDQVEKNTPQAKKSLSTSQNKKQTLKIWQNRGTSIIQSKSNQINLGNHKAQKKPNNIDRSGMSIYAKPQNTDHMKMVKNSSRQNMILLCLNKNTSTLITYEEMSVNPLKNGKPEQIQYSDKDRLYDKSIKLWDINYLSVYQKFSLSLQIIDMSLQSNGLYIVTKQRGYLGFYPFLGKQPQYQQSQNNPKVQRNKKQIVSRDNQAKLAGGVIINGNQIFFYTELQRQKNNTKIQSQGYENHLLNYSNAVTTLYNLSLSKEGNPIFNLQEIPSQINTIEVQNKLYVLSDTNGDKRYNLHTYDQLGNKESILQGTTRTMKYGVLENYSNMKKINHFQFNILLWNKHSLKFIGSNLEESYTVHWTISGTQRSKKTQGLQFDLRSLKSSMNRKQKQIEQVYIGENSIGIQQKFQNDLFRSITLSIFHLEAGRIKYRLNDIKSSFKVLQMYNNMILANEAVTQKSKTSYQVDQFESARNSNKRSLKKQVQHSFPSDDNEQMINLFDFNSPFDRKCVFTMKFKNLVQKNMTQGQIKQIQPNLNRVTIHNRFIIEKHISLEKARLFSLNSDDNIVLACVFRVKQQSVKKSTQDQNSTFKTKVLNSTHKLYLYCRQVSTQISRKLKYMPRTSDSSITKISKKVNFQYTGESQVHERVLGHQEIDLDEITARSTIKNFNYMDDLHFQSDWNIDLIVEDVTPKIIKFSEQQKRHQNFLSSNEKILMIYESSGNQIQNIANLNISWILAKTQSEKSIFCISTSNFFQIYQQQISCNLTDKNNSKQTKPNLQVHVQKICKVVVNESQKPFLSFWNQQFKKDNGHIWQQTKEKMVQYLKDKMTQQTKRQLNSPSNLCKKKGVLDQKAQTIKLRKSQNENENTQIQRVVESKEESQKKSESHQLNKMFRKWHISKNIQKQMLQYERNSNQAQDELNKQLRYVLQNQPLKEERIKYLLDFPQKFKDPHSLSVFQMIAKKISFFRATNDVSQIVIRTQQIGSKKTKRQKCDSKSKRLQENLQNSLLKKFGGSLDNSTTFSKIMNSSSELNSIKESRTSKVSQLKLLKNQFTYKKQQKSSINTHNQQLKSPDRPDKYTHNLRNKLIQQTTRTKTEMTDINYLQYINQTSLFPLIKVRKSKTVDKVNRSPNPQSSLSNIKRSFQNNIKQKASSPQSNNKKSIITRCKTQTSRPEQQLTIASKDALDQLKNSTEIITKSVLPQIKMNRQKLNLKMKQKKSFLKMINQRPYISKEQLRQEILRKDQGIRGLVRKI